jgi:Tfp pilus assembly protein FimT
MQGLVELRTKAADLKKRAFSLLEMLVVLGLLILLAALVVPTLAGFSESAEFRETCDQLSSAVSVCRSEAQRRGTPMELVARKESDGRVSIVGRPARLDDNTKESGGSTGQVLLVLPQGYSIDHDSGTSVESSGSPTASDNSDSQPGETRTAAAASEDDGPKPLIVFWANGGASKGSGLYLHGKGGRVVGAEINSFTGMLRLDPVADATSEKKNDSKDGKAAKSKPEAPSDVDPNGP